METIVIIVFGGVCFAVGMYVSSQIAQHVDNRTSHKEFMRNLEDVDKKDKDESRKA